MLLNPRASLIFPFQTIINDITAQKLSIDFTADERKTDKNCWHDCAQWQYTIRHRTIFLLAINIDIVN